MPDLPMPIENKVKKRELSRTKSFVGKDIITLREVVKKNLLDKVNKKEHKSSNKTILKKKLKKKG